MRWAAHLLAAGLAGCASSEPGEVTEETSMAQVIDPAADNQAVLSGLITGLVMTVNIDGGAVTLTDIRVARIPAVPEPQERADAVTISGFHAGQLVSSTAVADQRMNAEENGGLVTLSMQSLAVALPLPHAIDNIEVLPPGASQPTRIDVRKTLRGYCKESKQDPICAEMQ
jgi:hypothetical protein